MKGAEALAAALAAHCPSTIFGLLGDGNLLLIDELVAAHGARFVATRHEHAAVAAAMGWAHATGGIGVATTTHGPGLAQTPSALITAVKAGLPVLLVTGAVHPAARLHAQRCDQRALALACGADHVEVRSAGTVVDDLLLALRRLRRGPVVLDVDLGVLEADVAAPTVQTIGALPPAPTPAPDPEVVAAAAGLLRRARMPLVLLGRGAESAVDHARSLADRLGALVGTTLLGQGLLDDHPRQVGVVGGFSTPEARRALADVDLVLAVGASLTRYTVDKGTLFAGVPKIQIDAEPMAIGDPVEVDVALVADAAEALRAIEGSLGDSTADPGGSSSGSGSGVARAPGADLRGRALGDPAERVTDDPDGDDPRDVLEALDRTLPRDRAVVVGVGHYSGWAALGLRAPDPRSRLLPWDFGAVGVALGATIGVATADPGRPTICVEGDGGIMMTLPELDTLAREGLPVLVVVLDDRGYGAEADILRRAGRSTDRAWIPTPDLVTIARGLGLHAASGRVDDLPTLVAEALADLPALIHVPTSRRAVHHEIFAALGA